VTNHVMVAGATAGKKGGLNLINFEQLRTHAKSSYTIVLQDTAIGYRDNEITN